MSSVSMSVKPKKRVELGYRGQQRMWMLVRVVILIMLVIFALFPVVWVVSASFNPKQSMVSQTLIPQGVESVDALLNNYDTLLNTPRYPFWRWVSNSVIVATVTSFGTVMLCALSAYSFSRFRFYGRSNLLLFLLLVQVFPNILAIVAIYLLLQQIGTHVPFIGLNTIGGLILVYLGGAMGVNIWLMKGFFDTVPRDIDESALVDGANHWQTYWLLIFPLVRPILVVVGILSFVGTFNEFGLARVLLRDNETWTLMVGLYTNFVSNNFGQNWGIYAAGSVLGSLPTLIIYLLLQDQIVGGLTQGAVKG